MSLFEFLFGLTAVVLGLALTQLASNFQRLAMAGARVRWAPEPLLLTGFITLIIVQLWLGGWRMRDVQETNTGLMLMQITTMMMPYIAAGAVLPDTIAPEGRIDLLEHYDRTRRFTYGTMVVGMALGPVRELALAWAAGASPIPVAISLAFIAVYIALMWVRTRWINIVALLLLLLSGFSNLLLIKLHA